ASRDRSSTPNTRRSGQRSCPSLAMGTACSAESPRTTPKLTPARSWDFCNGLISSMSRLLVIDSSPSGDGSRISRAWSWPRPPPERTLGQRQRLPRTSRRATANEPDAGAALRLVRLFRVAGYRPEGYAAGLETNRERYGGADRYG